MRTHSDLAVHGQRTVEGYACPKCDAFWPVSKHDKDHSTAKRIAGFCCTPHDCDDCGQKVENTYWLICEGCRAQRSLKKWEKAERVEAGQAMIFADSWDRWFTDLSDYYDHLACEGLQPGDGHPYVGEFIQAQPPNLSESIADEMYEDWDGREDWLTELQKVVDATFEQNKPGAWHKSNKVPILESWTEEASQASSESPPRARRSNNLNNEIEELKESLAGSNRYIEKLLAEKGELGHKYTLQGTELAQVRQRHAEVAARCKAIEEDARAMAEDLVRLHREAKHALDMHLAGNPLAVRGALERILAGPASGQETKGNEQ